VLVVTAEPARVARRPANPDIALRCIRLLPRRPASPMPRRRQTPGQRPRRRFGDRLHRRVPGDRSPELTSRPSTTRDGRRRGRRSAETGPRSKAFAKQPQRRWLPRPSPLHTSPSGSPRRHRSLALLEQLAQRPGIRGRQADPVGAHRSGDRCRRCAHIPRSTRNGTPRRARSCTNAT